LLKTVRQGLKESQDEGLDEGVTRLDLMGYIQSFYDENAYCLEEEKPKPTDNSVLDILDTYLLQSVNMKEEKLVNAVDKLYVAAGWQLKGQITQGARSKSRMENDGLAAMSYSTTVPNSSTMSTTAIHYSTERAYATATPKLTEMAPQRTSARRASGSQSFSEPSKRPSERTRSGTSPSTKRSRPYSTQTAPSTTSESRTSFCQSQTSRELPCHCERTFPDKKSWEKHDHTHNPTYFYACLSKNCKHITLRQDSMVSHWKTTHRNESFTPELRSRQNANTFWILDRGHERCIFKNCDAFFHGDGRLSKIHIIKEHIIPHLAAINPAQDLSELIGHRCSDQRCGKDNHWKRSVYVTGQRYPYKGGTGSMLDSFGEEDGHERESNRSRVSIRQGSVGRENMNTRIGRENIVRTFNGPYPLVPSTAEEQTAAVSSIRNFMDDDVTYAVEPNLISARPSPDEAARRLRSEILGPVDDLGLSYT
jgi:hypothetical protein